jgi:hypothetical protein
VLRESKETIWEIRPANSSSLWKWDIGSSVEHFLCDPICAWASSNGWVSIFADETTKDRAEIRGSLWNRNLAVNCLDDQSVWSPDFRKSLELAKGYVSTAPAEVTTSVPSFPSSTRPAIERLPLVLVDERRQVRGVLLLQKGSDTEYEIHPVNSASVWKLDWDKSCARYFGEIAENNE